MTKIVIDTNKVWKWTKKVAWYALERLKEASTMRGLIVALTVLGWKLAPPEHVDAIVTIGTLLFSAIHALLPDQIKPKATPPKE